MQNNQKSDKRSKKIIRIYVVNPLQNSFFNDYKKIIYTIIL